MHYIELGRIYAQMGRKEEARKNIQKGLAMPDKEKDDPEMKEIGKQDVAKAGMIGPRDGTTSFAKMFRRRTTPGISAKPPPMN